MSLKGNTNNGQLTSAESLSVVLASDYTFSVTATNPSVSATGTPVPAQATYVGARNTTGGLSGLKLDVSGALVTTGGGGGSSALNFQDSIVWDYDSTPVDAISWSEITAATVGDILELFIFDSSGRIIELGTGVAGLESRVFIIQPGGPSTAVNLSIPNATRLSIRVVPTTSNLGDANTGELILTGLG